MDATTKVRNPKPEKRRQKWGRRSGSVNKITRKEIPQILFLPK